MNEINCSQADFSDGFVTSTDKLNDQNISQGGLLAGVVSLSILILVGIVIFIVVFIRLRNGRK